MNNKVLFDSLCANLKREIREEQAEKLDELNMLWELVTSLIYELDFGRTEAIALAAAFGRNDMPIAQAMSEGRADACLSMLQYIKHNFPFVKSKTIDDLVP